MPQSVTAMHRWFEEVWNQGSEDAIDEMMDDSCIAHGLTDANGDEITGVAPYKQFFRKFRADFPEIRVEVADVLVDGDRMAARCVVTGKHATLGKNVNFTGMTITRWKNRKIVEAWNNFDFHVMQQQLA